MTETDFGEPKVLREWTMPKGYEFGIYVLETEVVCKLIEENDPAASIEGRSEPLYTVFLRNKKGISLADASGDTIREAVRDAFGTLGEKFIRGDTLEILLGTKNPVSCKPHTKESLRRVRNLIITGNPNYLWNTCDESRV
jgi:hypothetical protein